MSKEKKREKKEERKKNYFKFTHQMAVINNCNIPSSKYPRAASLVQSLQLKQHVTKR